MHTEDFTIELFCLVDDKMLFATKHSQAMLFPSEVVTIALLFALKGRGNRAFYRCLKNNWRHLFPSLPHRTRLFRLFNTHRHWIDCFLAAPSLIGVIDSYGIELIHPRREGRTSKQMGKKGLSNQRWIVGGKLCLLLNHFGLVVGWDVDTANVYDGSAFQHLVTLVCHLKKVGHRVWDYFKSRGEYKMALSNILIQWHGLQPADDGFVHVSIAEFSL